jgi:hypothetical protein
LASDATIRCSCGSLEGRAQGLKSSVGIRLVCYCDDCQAFPWALDAADRVLDAHGGSDIFQTSPARIEFTRGLENLACLRLTEKGLLRWYASCCNSPICATLAMPSVPFVALLHSALECGGSPDAVLGPSRGGVNARFAKGDRASLDAHDKAPPGIILRLAAMIFRAWLRGDAKRSPFFRAGAPIAKPHVWSTDELARVEAARDTAG